MIVHLLRLKIQRYKVRERNVQLNNRKQVKISYQVMEIAFIVNWLFASQQLEQDDAVAVYIGFLIEAGCACILRVNVANCPHHIGRCVGLRDTQALGDTKVREMRLVVFV